MILITGANGLIGHAVCEVFNERNIPVIGVMHTDSGSHFKWETISVDLASQKLNKCIPSEIKIDLVVHCAAKIPESFTSDSDAKCAKINYLIDQNVLEFCVDNDVALCYMSSTSLYGESFIVKDENTALKLENDYSIEKYEIENKIIKACQNYCILRINAPYGARQKNNTVLNLFISNALENKDLIIFGKGLREQDFTAVEDIANAVFCYFEKLISGVYVIATGFSISMKSLAELILKTYPESKSEIKSVSVDKVEVGFNSRFDISKANNILGWESKVSLEKGIENWINYRKLQQ